MLVGLYYEGNGNSGDGAAEGETLRDVSCCGDGALLHNEEVGVEVWLDGEVKCHWVC